MGQRFAHRQEVDREDPGGAISASERPVGECSRPSESNASLRITRTLVTAYTVLTSRIPARQTVHRAQPGRLLDAISFHEWCHVRSCRVAYASERGPTPALVAPASMTDRLY